MKIALCEIAIGEDLEDLLAVFARGTIVETCDRAALVASASYAPDVAIIPNRASHGKGVDIISELRRNPAFARTDIWFAAAISDRADRFSALEAGACELLSSPIDLLELISRIRIQLKIVALQTQYESAIRDAEFLRRGIANAPGLLTLVDARRRYIAVSDDFVRLLGKLSSDVIGRKPEDVLHSTDGAIRQTFERELLNGGRIQPPKIEEVADAEGSLHEFLMARAPIRSPDGSIIGLTACGIPAGSLNGEALTAGIDRLTGLPTADALEELFAEVSARAAQLGKRVVIFRLAIRDLHEINDTLGRAMGDRLLLDLAQRLNLITMSLAETTNRILRHSGDGFTLIGMGHTEKAAVTEDIETLQNDMRRPFLIAGNTVETKIEFQSFSVDPLYPPYLIAGAIKTGSETGSDLIEIKSPLSSQSAPASKADPASAFARVLEKDQLFLHYQAQINLAAGSIAGVEALLRWRCPGHGVLLAHHILELARDAGAMAQLTHWVLTQTEKDATILASCGIADIRLCVNASLEDLSDPALHQAFMQTKLAMERVGVVLNVELAMQDATSAALESAVEPFLSLSESGIEITLDLGSAITREALNRFGFYASKIKVAFSANVPITDLAALAKSDLWIIASNIEHAEHLVAAREALAKEAQGFFIHQPTSLQELVVSMRQGTL